MEDKANMSLRTAAACCAAGVASGAAALALCLAGDALAGLPQRFPWAVALLPAAGLATFFLYRSLKLPFHTGAGSVLAGLDRGEPAPLGLAPAIFAATCLSLAAGGSVGEEAAALQMAAAIAPAVVALAGLRDEHGVRLASLCGMASALGVLLGAPLAASVLVFELFRPRRERLGSIVLVVAAALLSSALASAFSAERLAAAVAAPAPSPATLAQAAAVVAAGAACGALFCLALRHGRAFTQAHLHPVAWLVAGGCAFAALVLCLGLQDVSGTGMVQVREALAGTVEGPFFALKLALTAFLLACGFKGGEIMPTLCIGATLGCALGACLGGDAPFLAALGMVVLFSACTNCPLAAALLGVEAFGAAGAPWYVVGAAVAYLATSRVSLYRNAGPARDWPPLSRTP